MSNKNQHTPVIRQYLNIKEKHPDSFLFFRMGDFYELFFEDAEEASKILNITLTTRGKSAGNSVLLAGFPVHSSAIYIKKLIAAGKSIAVCEQIGDSENSRGLVERKVIRTITAGTILDEELLSEENQTYVASLDIHGGISWCEVATGDLYWKKLEKIDNFDAYLDQLKDIFSKHNIVELILSDKQNENSNLTKDTLNKVFLKKEKYINKKIINRPFWEFDSQNAISLLKKRIGLYPETLDLKNNESVLCSINALIIYIEKHIGQEICYLRKPQEEFSDSFIKIDSVSQNSLELISPLLQNNENSTLLSCLDICKTRSGSRKLKTWILSPLLDNQQIINRQLGIEWLSKNLEVRSLLKGINDISRKAARISLDKISPKELISLAQNINKIKKINKLLLECDVKIIKNISKIFSHNDMESLLNKITNCIDENCSNNINEGNIIKKKFDVELDEIRKRKSIISNELISLEIKEKQKTGLSTLKVGYNAVHGHFIEVSSGQKSKVPNNYIRRQTLKNVERYITPELKIIEEKFLSAREDAQKKEIYIFKNLIKSLKSHISFLFILAEKISLIDVMSSLSVKLVENFWKIPELSEKTEINITKGWHPVLENIKRKSFNPTDVLPNNTLLNNKNSMMLITGPNMSGKSTYMRQVALITILAKMGSPIPAEKATIGRIDKIFTRIGAADDLEGGRSTFMVEMTEAAKILNSSTKNSLVLMDEIGRGTSTLDGLSLAWAIAAELTQKNQSLSLFSTHYLELTKLPENFSTIKNFHITTVEEQNQIIFLYELKPGVASKSFGLKVAELAGIPSSVVTNAILTEKKFNQSEKNNRNSTNKNNSSLIKVSLSNSELVINELKRLDLDQLTPFEALKKLVNWKEKIK